jgi:hypothetical protein
LELSADRRQQLLLWSVGGEPNIPNPGKQHLLRGFRRILVKRSTCGRRLQLHRRWKIGLLQRTRGNIHMSAGWEFPLLQRARRKFHVSTNRQLDILRLKLSSIFTLELMLKLDTAGGILS